MTAHGNPANIAGSSRPSTNLFQGDRLAPVWRAIVVSHPDRFILAFDNVWPEFWGDFYLDQAKLWRKALVQLPSRVAHAVAHGNADRPWKLPVPSTLSPRHPTTAVSPAAAILCMPAFFQGCPTGGREA